MFNSLFLKDALERALKTFAQALLSLLAVAPATPVLAFDWSLFLGIAGTAFVVSLLTSLASAGLTQHTPTISPASAAPDKRGL